MKGKKTAGLTVILIALSLAMCIYGAARGESYAVFTKAATICMECIGLG